MADVAALRQKFNDKIAALDTGRLMECLDTLGAKPNKDAAERMTYQGLASEYARRLRPLVRVEPLASLRADYARLTALKWEGLRATDRALFWAIDGELEVRFPEEAEAAASWYDRLPQKEADELGLTAFADHLLASIPEE